MKQTLRLLLVAALALPIAWTVASSSPADAACSIGTTTLRSGSTGTQVNCLEQTLQAKGYQSTYIDEYFGSTTVTAVTNYQRDNGLYADGVVGPQTGQSLGIWGGTTTTAPPPTTTAPTTTSPPATTAPTTTTTTAPTAPSTTTPTTPSTTTPTTPSTPSTTAPTTPTTPSTTTPTAPTAPSTTAPTSTAPSTTTPTTPSTGLPCWIGTTTLRSGSTGTQVNCLERTLQAKGYQSTYIDNYYRSTTVASVINYQRDNGLYVDGIVGPQTGQSLGIWGNSTTTPTTTPTTPSTTTPTTPSTTTPTTPSTTTPTTPSTGLPCWIGTTTLRSGSTGTQVNCLERTLQAKGYQSTYIDNYYRSTTVASVINYQRDNGLYVDGIVGPQTGQSLGIWGGTTTTTPPPTAGSLTCAGLSSGRHAVIDRQAQRYILCNGTSQYGGRRAFTAGPINDAPRGTYSVFFERSIWWGGGYTLYNFTAFTYGDEGGRVAFHKYVNMPESGIGTEQYRNASDGCFRVSAQDALTTQNFLNLGSKVYILNNG